MQNHLKSGVSVTIFEDPTTETRPEGDAVLDRKIRVVDPNMEIWSVQFRVKDGVELVHRKIRVDSKSYNYPKKPDTTTKQFRPAINGQYRQVENRSPANQLVRASNHAIVLDGSYNAWFTPEQVTQAARLSERIRRYMNYCREIFPQWEDVGPPTYWADNSVSQRQWSPVLKKYRNVAIKPPSGDVCF